MVGWQATIETPIHYDYGSYRVQKCGPWAQGPVTLQQLAILSGFGLDGQSPIAPDFVHLIVEASKLAFADREAFYGDPKFVKVPVETLLSAEYNQKRRALISDRASLELRPGSIPGFGGAVHARASKGARTAVSATGAGEPTVGRIERQAAEPAVAGDTVHFDIIDCDGNMISATPSGGWLQSSPVIPELGFCLGTRAQMFWLDENHPAALVPGKRPRSTLSPTMGCTTASPTSLGARPVATSRTSGFRRCSCATSIAV
jgi:gamma-glutamyltranspeptidase/glutathione hydrolase